MNRQLQVVTFVLLGLVSGRSVVAAPLSDNLLLHSFPIPVIADGATTLVQIQAGDFLVTTRPSNSFPSILRVTPTGNVTVIHIFEGFNRDDIDRGPWGRLVQGADGGYYGTTAYGGDLGGGSIFRIDPDGGFATLRSFPAYSGQSARIVRGANGNVYGTYYSGDQAVFFSISALGTMDAAFVIPGGGPVFSIAPDMTVYGIRWQKRATRASTGEKRTAPSPISTSSLCRPTTEMTTS